MAYSELAGNGHFFGLSRSLVSSLHFAGNCAVSQGGSVEATLITTTCASLFSSANFFRSVCKRSIAARGDSFLASFVRRLGMAKPSIVEPLWATVPGRIALSSLSRSGLSFAMRPPSMARLSVLMRMASS